MTDNSENKDELIRELRERIEELRQSNQDLEHFAYVASHDLQAPLRTVEGYLGIIRKELAKENISEQLQEHFNHVTLGVQRLQQLIKDLLEYSRAGRMVERQRVKTYPMLEIVKYNLRHAVREAGAEITTAALPEEFSGHRMGITQLFQNLLANAVGFGAADRPNFIHVTAEDQDNSWRFSISDTGIGIDPADHQRIFELFTRLHPREAADKGTGIGLALCKRIVESHGGKIWLESEPGKGSTFHFTISKQ